MDASGDRQAYVLTGSASTVVVYGTAGDAELATLEGSLVPDPAVAVDTANANAPAEPRLRWQGSGGGLSPRRDRRRSADVPAGARAASRARAPSSQRWQIGGERLAALPQGQRLLERRAAGLEPADDVDELVAGRS